ncbi:MAG: Ig-like domain-containing protein [Chitinophagaceae bacterium]|nr:Ig-like domain-containing protein [Rubrivivax sp.]
MLTVPADGASAVANNTAITATFSEDMNPASISSTSFTLINTTLGTAVPGTVSYAATGRTAVFTPSTPATLPSNSAFTATITTAATDLAGNALAATVAWSFRTGTTADTTRPTVISVMPAANASNVPNNSVVSATFSEDMNPTSLSGSSFTVVNDTLGAPVAGTVSYSATGRTAVFTPALSTGLAANSRFTATITTAAADLAGNRLTTSFIWTFATVGAPDATRPTVTATVPTANAAGVANNSVISASFSEDMNPASLSAASFTLVDNGSGTAVNGSVSYTVATRTATFTPAGGADLAGSSSYTARITTTATDLAGNALGGNTALAPNAGDHVWTFVTAGGGTGTGDTSAPVVTAVSPPDGSTAVCRGSAVSATFNEAMAANTLNNTTFIVTDNGVAVPGIVSYDPQSRVVSFVPDAPAGLAANRQFMTRVRSGSAGVKDLAGNALAADRVWSFTTGAQACLAAANLRTVAAFSVFGGTAGVTNQGINTVVGGNLGSTAVCTAITGFHDGSNVYTETPLNVGAVNGGIFCAPPAPGTTTSLAIATQARADAQTAYNELAALPPGSDPGAGQLGGLTLPAAVYTAAGGSFSITNGDLTLDAEGNPDAVWVFQSGSALTVGQPALPRRVLLINGAQARNVFWQVGSAARIEDRSAMVGTIIANSGVTISTAGQTFQTTLTGRAISLIASVTMVNTTVVAP